MKSTLLILEITSRKIELIQIIIPIDSDRLKYVRENGRRGPSSPI